jgi:hypothetical protein
VFALGDVTFSPEALGVVVSVVGTLCTALVLVWREDARRTSERIADLTRQRDQLLAVVYRHGHEDEVPPSVPHSALPPRHPPDSPSGR